MSDQMSIYKQDLQVISNAVETVFESSLKDIVDTRRVDGNVMSAKVAICHYLKQRGHPLNVICKMLKSSRPSIYYCYRKHNDLLFADAIYKRSIAILDKLINQ